MVESKDVQTRCTSRKQFTPQLHRVCHADFASGVVIGCAVANGLQQPREFGVIESGQLEIRAFRLEPLEKLAQRYAAQRLDPLMPVVEAGDVVQFLAATGEEVAFGLDGDFFEGFQAVGDEAGTDHIDTPRAGLAQRLEGRGGVRLQPLRLAEA